MKTINKTWLFLKKYHYVIVLSMIVTIIFMSIRECTQNAKKNIKTRVETKIVKLPFKVTEWQHDTIIYPVYFPKNIDTGAIIRDYFANIRYDTVMYIKDTAEINLEAYISKNRIDSVDMVINYFKPEIKPKKAKLYIGGSVSNSIVNVDPGVSPELILVTKKENAYKIGYDIINNRAEIGMYWKLGKK